MLHQYRVISLDLRGHGDSGLTPDPYTIDGLAREVLALLDGLSVQRFVPVGHSMGGMSPSRLRWNIRNAWNAWSSSTP